MSSGRVRNSFVSLVLFVLYARLPSILAEVDLEDVCHLYQKKNFSGDPILSLRSSIKVFETPLIFHLPSTSNGISISSAKVSRPNCTVILCNGKHLKGECTEISESIQDLSTSVDTPSKVTKNVLSVDCHCSHSGDVETREQTDASALQLEASVSDKVKSKRDQPCSSLFRDWHYKGQMQSLPFPGSVAQIELGSYQVRSISVKDGCKLIMWGNADRYSLSGDGGMGISTFAESTSLLNLNHSKSHEWACCYCDQCSESVCMNAQSSSLKFSRDALTSTNDDFSQFVKNGKKIIGIGRNYRWKKVELAKVLSVPKEPIVFLKPTTSYITEGDLIELPQSLGTIFYELELGVVIGKRGKNISESKALDHVAGYFLALDMTAKEFIKGKSNQTSHPWEIGKGYDTACPVGDFIPKAFIPDPNNILLECKVNGEVTQSENTKEMIFNVRQLISYVSRYMTLEPYDTLLTGTPDGFGALKDGDVVEGRLGNLTSIVFTAVASSA